jgi:hypothetical protein
MIEAHSRFLLQRIFDTNPNCVDVFHTGFETSFPVAQAFRTSLLLR